MKQSSFEIAGTCREKCFFVNDLSLSKISIVAGGRDAQKDEAKAALNLEEEEEVETDFRITGTAVTPRYADTIIGYATNRGL